MTHKLQPQDEPEDLLVAEELILVRTDADLASYYQEHLAKEFPNSEKQVRFVFEYLSNALKDYFDITRYKEDPTYVRQAVMRSYHQLLNRRYDPKLVELMLAGMGFELRHEEGKQTVSGIRHIESGTDMPVVVETGNELSLFWKEYIEPIWPKSFLQVQGLWQELLSQPNSLQKYQVTDLGSSNDKYYVPKKDNIFNDVAKAYYNAVGRYGPKVMGIMMKGLGFELSLDESNRIKTMRHTLSGRTFEYVREKNLVREVFPEQTVKGGTAHFHGKVSDVIDGKK
jgi:hypothetical protein